MNNYRIFPKTQFYIIMSVVALLLFVLTIEVLFNVKYDVNFDAWFLENITGDITRIEAFQIYKFSHLTAYLYYSMIPILFGVQTYFAYTKTRVSKLYIFLWILLFIPLLIFSVIKLEFDSVFYYMKVILYLTIIISVLSLYIKVFKQGS